MLSGQLQQATRPHVSLSARAAASLLKRISAGFGMADGDKFAAYSGEVMAACERYSPEEVDRAAFALVRAKSRPHIGDVYDALDRARAASAPRKETGTRSTWNDLTLIIAWICGNEARWFDWQLEMGARGEGDAPVFIPEAKLRDFALRSASRLKRDFDDIVWKAQNGGWKGDGFEAELVRRLRYGLNHGPTSRTRERIAEFGAAA